MQHVIDLIPMVDVAILAIVAFFIYVGWKQGLPRLLMVLGSLYTGFLLASVYYHLFAVLLADMLKAEVSFTTDLLCFIALHAVVTGLMFALLVNLFGHIEIKGRASVFGRVSGSLVGVVSAAFIAAVLTTLLHAPVESKNVKMSETAALPVVVAFNNGYARSTIAPGLYKTAPMLLKTVAPLLPPDTKEKGAVPLLQSVVATTAR